MAENQIGFFFATELMNFLESLFNPDESVLYSDVKFLSISSVRSSAFGLDAKSENILTMSVTFENIVARFLRTSARPFPKLSLSGKTDSTHCDVFSISPAADDAALFFFSFIRF